jgi:hypothetical protein
MVWTFSKEKTINKKKDHLNTGNLGSGNKIFKSCKKSNLAKRWIN